MKTKTLRWLLAPLVFGVLVAIVYAPLPIPAYLDFQALYHANQGVLRGIPLYDLAGQVDMIAELASVTPDQVVLLPFVYPPWYSLLTLPLALMPIGAAARLWFTLNLLSVILFAWLVTEGWPARRRLTSFLLAILFLPVLGALFVGQFVFPVLLGGGLLIYGLRRERAWLTAFALFLLTFKPHIGGLVFLAGVLFLILSRKSFARRALIATGLILFFAFVSGFLVDSTWPVHYFETLFGFRDISPCKGLCISVPMVVTSILGMEFTQAVWLGGILFLGLSGWFIGSRLSAWRDASGLVAISFGITLLSSPYQYNYDFVVLLVPMFMLASRVQGKWDWFWLAFAYFLPWVGLIFGRQGNLLLLVSGLGLAFLLWRQGRASQNFLDVRS